MVLRTILPKISSSLIVHLMTSGIITCPPILRDVRRLKTPTIPVPVPPRPAQLQRGKALHEIHKGRLMSNICVRRRSEPWRTFSSNIYFFCWVLFDFVFKSDILYVFFLLLIVILYFQLLGGRSLWQLSIIRMKMVWKIENNFNLLE